MKKIFITFLGFLIISINSGAHATDISTGQKYLDKCANLESKTQSSAAEPLDVPKATAMMEAYGCVTYINAYINGVHEATLALMNKENILPKDLSEEKDENKEARDNFINDHSLFCIPFDVTLGQTNDIFLNFLKNNSAKANLPTEIILMQVLMQTYPCSLGKN